MTNGIAREPLSIRNGGGNRSAWPPRTPTKDDRGNTESPASVVTIPLSDMSTPRKLRSTIAMGDSGAEVTLDLSALDMNHNTENDSPQRRRHFKWGSPKKARESFRPMNALLDSDITPSPAKQDLRNGQAPSVHPQASNIPAYEESTPSPQFLGDSMCCATKCWQADSPILNLEPANDVQGQISVLLSSPVSVDIWCNSWQAWYYVRMDSEPNQEIPQGDIKTAIQRGLRNRATDMNARKHRLATLRKDLNPFQQTPPKARNGLVKARSFNIVDHAPAIARYSGDKKSQQQLPSVWESVNSCTTLPVAESPEILRSIFSNASQEDAGYDSDPEDFIRRARPNNSTEHADFDDLSLSATSSNSIYCPDDAIIVRELMNEKLRLILHPSESKGSISTAAPQAVSVWIEHGRRVRNELVSPKFVWKSLHKSNQKVSYQRSEVSSVDILDIDRILPVEKLNRSSHPFAKTRHTFLMRSIHGETYMFEASSASERDRLVHSIKLMIARLGSMLVVQDDNVLEEFFIGVAPSPHFLDS
jgi:hypothetical protein